MQVGPTLFHSIETAIELESHFLLTRFDKPDAYCGFFLNDLCTRLLGAPSLL